jgi:hypothetical protein
MFRLLKKLTSRLVRVFGTLLPLVLAAPAMAQWGAVTSQPDTNRFINSQQDFGLIMPHQQVIVGMLDTTISSVGIRGGNAFKVIVGSLLDYEDNCVNYTIVNGVASCAGSYERWRELEKSTSWYQADRGDTTRQFPTNYAVTISTGLDSINIWNRDTAELWMAFKGGGSNYLWDPDNNDAAFKDGIIYSAQTGDFQHFDFLTEDNFVYTTTTLFQIMGNIQQRNDASRVIIAMASSPTIAHNTVNAVAAVRDPFGLKDALGRPKHWWIAATAGDMSMYNPHQNAIYDEAGSDAHSITSSRRMFAGITDNGSIERANMIWGPFDIVADGWQEDQTIASDQTGANDIAWGSSTVWSEQAIIEGASIVGVDGPVTVWGSDQGVYLRHYFPGINLNTGPAKQRFSATVNAPVEFGDAVLALALEDNTTDSSPYGNTMTANNSPGTIAAVFGNGYSSKGASSSLTKSGATGLDGGTASFWGSLWVYPTENTNGRVLTFNGDSNTDRLMIAVNVAANSIQFQYTDDGYSTLESANWSGTIRQDGWTHIAFTRDSEAILNVLWVDGIRAATDVALNEVAASLNWDDIGVGDDVNGGGQHFYGRVDDLAYGQDLALTDEVVARIYAEGRKKLAMGTPVFTSTPDDALISNNVVDIDALDNGMWAVAFSDANTVQVFDGRIPVQQIAAPAGTVKSIALIQSPGTDSVGVAIGTTTNLKFVQPSVNLRAAMAHQYQEPIHVGSPVVVDSAGIGGIFWTGTDAVDAAANAGRGHVKFAHGTYGPISIAKAGMIVEGIGTGIAGTARTYICNTGSITSDAITVTGAYVTLRNFAYGTAPGAAGGAMDGIQIAASYILVTNTRCEESDNVCINTDSNYGRFLGNHFTDADGWIITLRQSNNIVDGNQMLSGGTGAIYTATWDNNIISNNVIHNNPYWFLADSGSNYHVIIGNRAEGTYTNNGTGSTKTGNNETAF